MGVMKEFIGRVGGAIRGLFNHNSKPDLSFSTKNVFSVRNGKSFRGHGMQMHTYGTDNSKFISFNNNYYLNNVSCVYNITLNKTNIVERTNSKTPKYILQFIEHLQCKYKKNIETIKYEHVDKGEKIIIWITKGDVVCNRKYTKNNIHFNNHYDNINNLKDLTSFVSKIKSLIRNTDYDTLMLKHIEASKHKRQLNFIT